MTTLILIAILSFLMNSSATAQIGGTPEAFCKFLEKTFGEYYQLNSCNNNTLEIIKKWPNERGQVHIVGKYRLLDNRIQAEQLEVRYIRLDDKSAAGLFVPFIQSDTGRIADVNSDMVFSMMTEILKQLPRNIDLYSASADQIEDAAEKQKRIPYPKPHRVIKGYQITMWFGFFTDGSYPYLGMDIKAVAIGHSRPAPVRH